MLEPFLNPSPTILEPIQNVFLAGISRHRTHLEPSSNQAKNRLQLSASSASVEPISIRTYVLEPMLNRSRTNVEPGWNQRRQDFLPISNRSRSNVDSRSNYSRTHLEPVSTYLQSNRCSRILKPTSTQSRTNRKTDKQATSMQLPYMHT